MNIRRENYSLSRSFFTKALFTTLIFSYPAYSGIKIESYSGSKSKTAAGAPILASNSNGEHLNRFTRNGNLNNYTWVDQKNRVLSQNLVFTPTNRDIGKKVKLCKVKGTSITCSNKLRITSPTQTVSTRSISTRSISTRTVGSFASNWTYENKLTDNLIFDNDTQLEVRADYEYTGPTNATSGPIPTMTLARVIDVATNSDLISLTPLNTNPNTSYSDHSFPFTFNINYGNTSLIRFCTTVMVSESLPAFVSEAAKCVERMVRDSDIENSNSTFFYPPSPSQFNSLFPTVTFKNNESVTQAGSNPDKQYTLGPRVATGHSNLLSEYCSSIGPGIVPLSENELITFLSSSNFDNTWPNKTSYWTNATDNTEPLASAVPSGMGIVAGSTTGGNVESSAAANAYYRGFYVCKKS